MLRQDEIKRIEDVPLDLPVRVPVELLRLDPHNYRLIISDIETNNDEAVVKELHENGELLELLKSIAANGYLDFEPLVVLREPARASRLTVLEGNRRLAAIRLLTNAALAQKLAIELPSITADKRRSLDAVRVIRVSSRETARPFIAFKHINGPHRWESFAKARFAADWYKDEQISLREIAESIGDNHETIKRMVSAIYILDQAESQKLFSLEDRATKKFNFSHLYTALGRTEYMKYLQLADGWASYNPRPNPIKKANLPRLREVLSWIFGSKSNNEASVIGSQNPDIKDLGRVLASASAVHILRETRNLDKALIQAIPGTEKLSSALVRAHGALQEAVSNLRAFDGNDRSLYDIAEDIHENAKTLTSRMKEKIEQKGDS